MRTIQKPTIKALLASIAALGICSAAQATPVYNAANGHYYDINSNPLTWSVAKAAAEALQFNGMNGHLVTITSAAEQSFLEREFACCCIRQQ